MSNTFLTPQMITKELMRILVDRLLITSYKMTPAEVGMLELLMEARLFYVARLEGLK
jgi:hypothetical protein